MIFLFILAIALFLYMGHVLFYPEKY
ncbi:MAG: potassium-transporting ATPase subunit F [Candidatus Kapabacteria bacterium]|nr:potassium-transporting ATPase subunit F [Ignavibacteria bacterium]MBN8572407.1 potassium-transporting ATPase subunit F [Candidatus Kapabacteria bacterium]